MKKLLVLMGLGACLALAACSNSSNGGDLNHPNSNLVGVWSPEISKAASSGSDDYKDNYET